MIIKEIGLTYRQRASWLTGSVRRGVRKAVVRATDGADMVESLLAWIRFRCSLAKMSAAALRPCSSVWIQARTAGASRCWRSWKESESGYLSTPTHPPRNESMTEVVSIPILAISSESTRYPSGMLARHGDLESRDLSGIRSVSSRERRGVALGIAECEIELPSWREASPA